MSRLSPNFPPGLPSGSPPRNLLSTADAVDVVHGRGSRGGEIARRQIQLGIFVRRFLTKQQPAGHVTLADGDTSGSRPANFHILRLVNFPGQRSPANEHPDTRGRVATFARVAQSFWGEEREKGEGLSESDR